MEVHKKAELISFEHKMRFKNKNNGVAGLTILLSLVTMLFVIGLLVMIFSLMGGELRSATFDDTTVTVTNETNIFVNTTGDTLSGASALNAGSFVITAVWDEDSGAYNVTVPTANVSVSSAGVVTNGTATTYDDVSLSYTYHYDAENTATEVMNDTTAGVSGVTDWFEIFLVIGAMVVLVLLVVIIISAIRGSGLIAGGSA